MDEKPPNLSLATERATLCGQHREWESLSWFLMRTNEWLGEVGKLAIALDMHNSTYMTLDMSFSNVYNGFYCRNFIMNL